jgi:hypothetical protein
VAEPIRSRLDEHIDGAMADGPRRHGIDVTTTAGVTLRSATDEEQLALASAEQPVMVR